MTEAQLCKVENANEALDCPDRIVRSDIVLNPGRKETGLVPANEPVKKSSQFPANCDSMELWAAKFLQDHKHGGAG
jgi:hypothetical protein